MKRITQAEIAEAEAKLAAASPAQVAPLVRKLVKMKRLFLRQ